MGTIVSCGIYEITDDRNVGGGALGGMGGGLSQLPVCYVTAFEYQKDYNWRSDQERETVKCSLIVYADEVPIMKLPVGSAYEIGSDPDMHRILQRHLYTDYSTESETIIKKDGVELYRYSGREAICGMEIMGEDIYALGQSRTGQGFSYRRNGEVVLKREYATVIGRLINDNGSLCFAFCEPIQNADRPVSRYYSSVDGRISQVAVREDIKTIWDILVCQNETIYVASLVGFDVPVLCVGEKMTALEMPSGASLLSCGVFKTGDRIGVEGVCQMHPGVRQNIVWVDGAVLSCFVGVDSISALDTYDDGVFCAMNPLSGSQSGLLYRSGEGMAMPKGYAVMGIDAVRVIDGIMYVGLSSIDGRKPLIWKDGVVDSLDINGYISSIYEEPQY